MTRRAVLLTCLFALAAQPSHRRQLRRAAGHVSDGALVGARHDRLHRSADPQSAARRLRPDRRLGRSRAPTVSRSPSSSRCARSTATRRPPRSAPASRPRRTSRSFASELSQVVEHGLLRAGFAALIGGILGGFMAGALLAASGAADTGSPRSGNGPRHLTRLRRLLRRLAHAPGSAVVPRARSSTRTARSCRGCSPSRRKCSKPERRTRTPTTAHSTA